MQTRSRLVLKEQYDQGLSVPYSDMYFEKYLHLILEQKLKIFRNFRAFTSLLLKGCNRKVIFLLLNQSICCGYSKEPSHRDGSFEHPKHMLKPMDKKVIAISRKLVLLNWPCAGFLL